MISVYSFYKSYNLIYAIYFYSTEGESESDFHQRTIYPWVEQRCNNIKFEDTVRPVKFPDVFPGTLPYKNRFSMIAGDFLEVCSDEGC